MKTASFSGNGYAPLLENAIALKGLYDIGTDIAMHLEMEKSPMADILRKDLLIQYRERKNLWVVEAGAGESLKYSYYVSTLESGIGLHPLSHTANYSDGFFEGMKVVRVDGKAYFVHPADNFERLEYSAKRLGYGWEYSAEKLTYLSMLNVLMNGWGVGWPKIDGKEGTMVYLRPLLHFPFNGGVGIGGRHADLVSIIPAPMNTYFEKDKVLGGVNVLFYDTPLKQAFASIPDLSLKQIGNYGFGGWLKNLAQGLPEKVAETVVFNFGKLKEGSSDTVAIIEGNAVVFPPFETGRLKGITGRFVEASAERCGFYVKHEEITLERALASDGLVLFGNAVNLQGVGKIYVQEKFLREYRVKDAMGKTFERKEFDFEGSSETFRVYSLDTASHPVFRRIQQAFEMALKEYSICFDDVFVPDAAEKLAVLGKSLRRKIMPESGRAYRLQVPNMLKEGADLSGNERLYPHIGARLSRDGWADGLRAKKMMFKT